MELYRVLLADDEEEIREGISRKIDWDALGFTLVGQAENGAEALEMAEQLRPDVVLTDIKMPFMDGLELCRQLKPRLPAAKLVVFSGFDDFAYAQQAIGLEVSEYILKPINAAELESVLTRLRQQIVEERLARRDVETLRRRYAESLPVLRELFYNQLLDGRIPQSGIAERAARYEIDLPEGCWTVAMVQAGGLHEETAAEQDNLLLMSVQSFFDSQFSLEGCTPQLLLYNDQVTLLVPLGEQERIYPLIAELERLCILAKSLLNTDLTVGVGLPCANPGELRQSMEGARTALAYRVRMGTGCAIYIGDIEPDNPEPLALSEDDQRALTTVIRLGTEEQLEALTAQLLNRARESRLPLPQCQLYFMELLLCLIRLGRSCGLDMGTVLGQEDGGMDLSRPGSLETMERWFTSCCKRLRELLSRQRSDSAGRTIERAIEYIQNHYADSDLNVEVLCTYLHLSPSYFSTLFKREMGMSFTAYVTQLRMEQAAALLRQTEEKTYLIAEKTGYADPNYFSYVFKRHFGMSPSKYRAGG